MIIIDRCQLLEHDNDDGDNYTSFILITVSDTLSRIISFNPCPFLFNCKPSSKTGFPPKILFPLSSNIDTGFDKANGRLCRFNLFASRQEKGVVARVDLGLGVLFVIVPKGVPSAAMFPFWTVFRGALPGVVGKIYT